jgi:hypothetical protein
MGEALIVWWKRDCRATNHDGTGMVAAFYILLVAGHLGFFDVLYFHIFRCRLQQRPECQGEVLWHTARHFIYASQFVIIANLRFHGAALLLLLLLYGADVFIAWSDVWEEHDSRRIQGGLPRGEYFTCSPSDRLCGPTAFFQQGWLSIRPRCPRSCACT